VTPLFLLSKINTFLEIVCLINKILKIMVEISINKNSNSKNQAYDKLLYTLNKKNRCAINYYKLDWESKI
jgi:hypothetical protein